MVTVFTPTYNRAYTLGNLYRSLKAQTSHDFEWIVIDDGSEDETEDLVRQWIQETQEFLIIYRKVPNGGKHRAINVGVNLAKYEAFFIVDSDDCLTEDAIGFILAEFPKIADDDRYAGISGLRMYKNGEIIGGTPTFSDYVDTTNFERVEYSLSGDKAEVYKTSVLKRYPFPEFADEAFLTEAVVWDAIAFDGLKIRWFNRAIYITEYMPDGLSQNIYMKMKKNPFGWAEWIRRERLYGRMKDKELSDTVFAFIERVELSEDVICRILQISEREYDSFKKRKERIFSALSREIDSCGLSNMALYGYGQNARRLLEYLKDIKIEIPYVIDKRHADIREMTAYSLEMELPEVESVCITLKKPEPEIMEMLKERLPSSYIWQLSDLGIKEW